MQKFFANLTQTQLLKATLFLLFSLLIILAKCATSKLATNTEHCHRHHDHDGVSSDMLKNLPKIRLVVQHLILVEEEPVGEVGRNHKIPPGPGPSRKNKIRLGEAGGGDPARPAAAAGHSRQESILEIISETPNSQLILEGSRFQDSVIHLECASPYPVGWSYEGDGFLDPTLTFVDSSRVALNYSNSSTYTFMSKLDLIILDEQITGRYSCKSLENPKLVSYFYIYVPGKNIFVATKSVVKAKVETKAIAAAATAAQAQEVIQIRFPCTVSHPNTSVGLFKIDKGSSYLQELEIRPPFLSYDPRSGFTMVVTKLPVPSPVRVEVGAEFSPWGDYVCIESRKRKLLGVSAEPETLEATRPDSTNSTRQPSLSYNSTTNSFQCCRDLSPSGTATTNPPLRLKVIPCSNQMECQIRSHGSGSAHHEKVGNGTNEHCINFPLNQTITEEEGEGVEISNFLLHDGTSTRAPRGGLFLCGIAGAESDTPPADRYYFTLGMLGKETPILLTPDAVDEPDPPFYEIMEIKLKNTSRILQDEEIEVECHTNKFFFAKGHAWFFEWANGTQVIVGPEFLKQQIVFKHTHGPEEERVELREVTTIKFPHTSISKLLCSAPVWNSKDRWRNISLPVLIANSL